MSVAEEVRGVMQDFLAPELRALKERVGALERKVDENERRAEQRFQETHGLIDQRFEDAERHAEKRHTELVNWLNLAARVSKLEQKESTQ